MRHSLAGNVAAPRSPFGSSAGSRTVQSSANSLLTPGRRLTAYGSGLGIKKPAISSVGQSPYSLSVRSTQSVLGIRSEFNVIESYGLQLPLLVQEALAFNEKPVAMSVRCSPSGWAWFVQGRRLLIWQYKKKTMKEDEGFGGGSGGSSTPRTPFGRSSQKRANSTVQCRELSLSHCDIGHKASLVSVFLEEGQTMASCIAVSPTGDARYWASIAHDNNSSDCNGILDGQEFDTLQTLPKGQGYLLVTTTCQLVHLQLDWIKGRYVLQHKPIKQPAGFLGGLSRRLTGIIGLSGGLDRETKFINMSYQLNTDEDVIATVLSDRWIQRWRIATKNKVEMLLFEDSEVIRKLREEFQMKFWNSRPESVEVKLHLLDMHESDGKFYLLAGAVNSLLTPQMYYGFAVLSAVSTSMQPLSFIPLKYSQFYSSTTEHECLSLRFIICRMQIYFYNDKVVYPLNLSNATVTDIEADKIEFHMHDDRILGAAVCDNIPLFFSTVHGIVSVTPSDFDASEMLAMSINTPELYSCVSEHILREQNMLSGSINENNLNLFSLDPDTIYHEFKDSVNQLKAAFLYKIKRDNKMCNMVLNDLLRVTGTVDTQISGGLSDANQLDKIVITMAQDLAEDIPSADPRWDEVLNEMNGNKNALGSSTSLHIVTQLKEKNFALRHFVDFLHSTGIWDKLNAVPSSGGNVTKPTCYVISDIHEKIIAAIALRTIQSKFPTIIEDSIVQVVNDWKEVPQGSLTAQDLFYVRLCKFQDIFQTLIDIVNKCIDMQQHVTNLATLISNVNTIVLHLITEVQKFRDENSVIYTLSADKMDTYEYLPWTAMSGRYGIRDAMSNLVDLSVRNGARCAHDSETKQRLYQQILELIDFILNGRKNYLESVRETEKYNVLLQQFESQRKDLISILIDDRQYELAVKLAEKYLDFQSLVIICDLTDDQERLDSYIKKYEEFEFSQIAINWHLNQNRRGDVFERFKGNQAALSQFMRDHPTLGWIQLVFNGDFDRAAKLLFQLAQSETEYVARKRSMLSLAKLAAFAAADSDLTMQVENMNAELTIIDYQESLSDNLLESFGFDVEHPRVLKVEEIINLLIAEENYTGNDTDFRKALELLSFLDEPYELRNKIWCAAILRDNWLDYEPDDAINYIQNLLFYKLVEISHLIDGELETFLPAIEEFLNSSDLGELPTKTSFQFLLKFTYEYIYNNFKHTDEEMADA